VQRRIIAAGLAVAMGAISLPVAGVVAATTVPVGF